MKIFEILKEKLLLKEESPEERRRKEIERELKEVKKVAKLEKKLVMKAYKNLEKGPTDEDKRRFEEWIEKMKTLKQELRGEESAESLMDYME